MEEAWKKHPENFQREVRKKPDPTEKAETELTENAGNLMGCRGFKNLHRSKL